MGCVQDISSAIPPYESAQALRHSADNVGAMPPTLLVFNHRLLSLDKQTARNDIDPDVKGNIQMDVGTAASFTKRRCVPGYRFLLQKGCLREESFNDYRI
jgi:hypothetical protein